MVFEEGFSKLLQAESIIYKNGKNYLAVNGKIVGVQEIDENGNTYISPNVEEITQQTQKNNVITVGSKIISYYGLYKGSTYNVVSISTKDIKHGNKIYEKDYIILEGNDGKKIGIYGTIDDDTFIGSENSSGKRYSTATTVQFNLIKEPIKQQEIKVSTVEYKGKPFIIEGSEEEGNLKIFYQAQGGKGEEVKDVNLFNKVFVAHTADIHPEWVVTLTGIQNQPKYLVGNNSEIISLQNTDYGKVIQSKDVIQKVMSLYYDKSQIENLKIKPEETLMSTENVFDITEEDLPVEKKPVKKEKRINVPKGSNPNNNVIMETEDTVFLMNNGQQEAFNFIKGKVEELLNNKKRIDVNDLDNTVIFNDPLTNKFNGLFPVEMWNNMIGLAGRGGVGKTTVIKAIIAAIEGKNKYAQPSVMYLAPSHTAATVLQEAIGLDSEKANDGKVNTIQSHLRMRPDSNNIFNLISEYNYLKSAKFKPSFGQPNIIIIDEASMVSAIMIKDMITRLKTDLRNGLISNMPVFIFMGDYRQLGPINEKQNQFVNKGPISSTLFLDNSKTKELTEVMRSDNELLHKIYDSIGEQTVSNMTKTKNKEELKNPSFSKYDQLTKKSTENMLIVSNQEGVIDDYVTYLSNNNNPYGMFWIHYNNTDNSITKNLAAKIRKAYFNKIEQPILEEKYRLFSKHDYIEFTGGVEISTDDNFNYTITDDKIKNLIEKQKYNKIEDNVYKIGSGVIKPNARFKVLDIVNRKDNLSALLHPNLKSYLPKNIIVDVETSILYNRQDKIRALSKALDISVGPIIDGKFGRYSEGTKSQEGITIKNNKTGEILAKFDLPYGTFIDVEENLKMLNSTNATMPFVPSYIGSSHTAQGNSIKNVIVGDYNIKQAAANGRTHIDDVFSSMYVALTRTSGTVIIIKPAGADIVNNQEVFLGAITDDNQAQRMTSASEMPNKFEEIEIQEAEETIDFMDNVIQQIIMDSQKEVIEDTFGKDKNASSILNTVYKNTTPFYKEILKLVSKTGGIGNLKIVVDENMTDPGSYDLYNETITINPNLAFELNPGNANALYDVLIHELLHHVTAKIVNADKSTLTLEQRKWVVSLENLFKFTQDKILNDPIHGENLRKTIEQVNKEGGFLSVKDKSMYYGLTNINEFISMLMSDADFRSFMNNVSYSGEKSLFERFIDIFVNILKSLGVTVKDDTVLKEGIGNIIGIIESRNEGNVATNQTLKSIKTQTFVDGIVESEFEKIIKYLDIKTKCK
jgi:DNA polymerase III delta prime subunit